MSWQNILKDDKPGFEGINRLFGGNDSNEPNTKEEFAGYSKEDFAQFEEFERELDEFLERELGTDKLVSLDKSYQRILRMLSMDDRQYMLKNHPPEKLWQAIETAGHEIRSVADAIWQLSDMTPHDEVFDYYQEGVESRE